MKKFLLLTTLIIYGIMIYVNYLSGTGQINGISAGEVSAMYPTLFTPAGFTFSIWGLIYIAGLVFIYRLFRMSDETDNTKLFMALTILYIVSCILNISWIYSWHHYRIWISEILMIGLLITLILLYQKVSEKPYQSLGKYLSTITPISLYLGWICIAMVANTSVLLSSLGWDGSPFTESFWATLMIIIAALLNLIILIRKRDIFFALVFLWAAYGIIMARSEDPINENIWVSRAAIMGMIIVFLGILYARFIRVERSKSS